MDSPPYSNALQGSECPDPRPRSPLERNILSNEGRIAEEQITFLKSAWAHEMYMHNKSREQAQFYIKLFMQEELQKSSLLTAHDILQSELTKERARRITLEEIEAQRLNEMKEFEFDLGYASAFKGQVDTVMFGESVKQIDPIPQEYIPYVPSSPYYSPSLRSESEEQSEQGLNMSKRKFDLEDEEEQSSCKRRRFE